MSDIQLRKRLTMIGFLLGIVAASVGSADSWSPPTTTTYLSADGTWRLTVHPRDISSPLNYFQDKVDNRPNAGGIQGSRQTSAVGQMERRSAGKWQVVWKEPLLNDVSPVGALVTPGGQTVTLDNWHSVGHGKDAVVIYDTTGKPIRVMALSDFLPKSYITALPHTVSSIHWRGDPKISQDGRQLILPVVIPSIEQEELSDEGATYVDIRFDLATGKQTPDTSKAWSSALEHAERAYQKLKADQAAAKAAFIAPLLAPNSTDESDWYDYLTEAYFRLDPHSKDGYPATTVIRLPASKDFAESVDFMRQNLTDDLNMDGTIMFASPSQEALVKALAREAANVKTGALSKARIYVVVDDMHADSVSRALSHTGATFIQLAPTKPIPQRKERLERYLQRSDEEE